VVTEEITAKIEKKTEVTTGDLRGSQKGPRTASLAKCLCVHPTTWHTT